MWFDTLILQLRLHMAYRVNGILYRLRFLRLPYENSFAKTLGLVLAVLREIFGILLGKLLYMAVFFAAPLLLIRRELPPELYGHLLVFLTLIGGIFNNNLLNGGRDAYYAVILLRMDARRYTLSAYGYYLLKTAVGFLAAALLVGHLILRQGLALCLLTPVLVCGVKLLSAGLELRHFHRRGILPRDEKRFSLLQGTSVLLLAAAYLPPLLLNRALPSAAVYAVCGLAAAGRISATLFRLSPGIPAPVHGGRIPAQRQRSPGGGPGDPGPVSEQADPGRRPGQPENRPGGAGARWLPFWSSP